MNLSNKQKKEIGKRIQYIRKEVLKKTQIKMMRILKVKQAMISHFERGTRLPSVEVLLSLNKISFKSIDWILTGKD